MIQSSLRLIRHIKRIVQHSRGLDMAALPYLALGLECVVDVEAMPHIAIHRSMRLIRHIKRIVQHSRGLGMAASRAILG